jgi:predicted alpha/beta hydrolase
VRRSPVLLPLLLACATASEGPLPAGASLKAQLQTADGAPVTLLRWTPAKGATRRVLVVPELGFDRSLVAPLCRRLRDSGWDVATLEGRHLGPGGGRREGWDAWLLDVAAAAGALQPDLHILALGVGGAAAWTVAGQGGAKGVVAVNVPVRMAAESAALADALAESYFDPAAWLQTGRGPVLLGAGRRTPGPVIRRLADAAKPLPKALRRDLAALYAVQNIETLPDVPVRLLVSVRDNLVPAEDALVLGQAAPAYAAARRMGKIELFARNYGHLDWLADDEGLSDVFPVLLGELEALP